MNDLPRLRRDVVQLRSLESQGNDQRVIDRTPEECLNMVWPLTLAAWALAEPSMVESRLQRHVTRVTRLEN